MKPISGVLTPTERIKRLEGIADNTQSEALEIAAHAVIGLTIISEALADISEHGLSLDSQAVEITNGLEHPFSGLNELLAIGENIGAVARALNKMAEK